MRDNKRKKGGFIRSVRIPIFLFLLMPLLNFTFKIMPISGSYLYICAA
jgi:hypothetical protein